jgi:2-polyprenyl-6-methoxyphenol hydroxylase-like FAD-dependent oxidoreductase
MSIHERDVVIAGGGLAGLGLAWQLSNERPELDIAIVERATFPINNTTPKVGESTVEIASRYFMDTLGLGDHFFDKHLQKFGLRCFFGEPQSDFSHYDELGASNRFPVPTYQLERGTLENYLVDGLRARGVCIDDGSAISGVDLDSDLKRLSFKSSQGEDREYKSRWLVDCSGRFGLLKRAMNLGLPSNHKGNALWFRIDKTLKIDEWTHNQAWHERVALEGRRWLSTNHLMGPGYWVWIIPLASGATSIGVVMDDQAWDDAQLIDYPSTLAWLEKRHPQLAQSLDDVQVLDFVALEDYSYSAKRVISADGWALSGEAGVFADPFYSPGSDFIAMGNEIISHLIVSDSCGKSIGQDARIFDAFYKGFFENTVSLYRNEYGGWGDRVMMSGKLTWDYCFYWGILALLYYRGAMTDATLLRSVNGHLMKALSLNARVQGAFKERAKSRLVLPAEGLFIDQYGIPVLHELVTQLEDDSIPLESALVKSLELMNGVAPSIIGLVQTGGDIRASLCSTDLLGELRRVA